MTRRHRQTTYRKRRRRKKITLQPLTPEAHALVRARHQARARFLALRSQWRAEDSAYRAGCVAAGEAKMIERRGFPLRSAAEITHRSSPP